MADPLSLTDEDRALIGRCRKERRNSGPDLSVLLWGCFLFALFLAGMATVAPLIAWAGEGPSPHAGEIIGKVAAALVGAMVFYGLAKHLKHARKLAVLVDKLASRVD